MILTELGISGIRSRLFPLKNTGCGYIFRNRGLAKKTLA